MEKMTYSKIVASIKQVQLETFLTSYLKPRGLLKKGEELRWENDDRTLSFELKLLDDKINYVLVFWFAHGDISSSVYQKTSVATLRTDIQKCITVAESMVKYEDVGFFNQLK